MINTKGLSIISAAALALFGACASAAEPEGLRLQSVSRAEAEQLAAGTIDYQTSVAMWIWTDKVVYQPGESLTLHATIKSNNDFYPYALFAFRQNNQTGAKTFVPGGTSEATDVFGNTAAQGFRITRVMDATQQVVLGQGGAFGGAVTIPNELGMHTIVVQLRDYTGSQVMKTAYVKFSVVDGFDDIQGNIESNRTLVNTRGYRLRGVVYVRNGAVLTIPPGTVIQGQPGSQPPSVLVVTRNGRIDASGTRSRPIIMTSSQPVGQRRRGDWGGLILLGSAPGNVPAERAFVEGLPQNDDTRYGGDNENHNCGALRYVRVEFAGAELAPNNEVNGITWAGCGRQTVSEYLQSTYGFDDAFEWFGGTSDAKYLVATYPGDDHIDTQLGYRGRIQHVVILQNEDRGNRGIEADNSEFNFTAEPRGNSQMWNFTIIGSGLAGLDESNSPGVFLRRGAVGTYNNMIVTNFFSTGVELNTSSSPPGGGQDPTVTNLTNNQGTTINGILLWNNGRGANPPAANTVEAQVHSAIRSFVSGLDKNFIAADPMLRRPFEFSDPNFLPLPGSPVLRPGWLAPPDDGFLDQWASWLGAFGDVDWTEEWTSFLQESELRQ